MDQRWLHWFSPPPALLLCLTALLAARQVLWATSATGLQADYQGLQVAEVSVWNFFFSWSRLLIASGASCLALSLQVRCRSDAVLAGGQALPSGVRHASCGVLRLPSGRSARRRLLRRRVQTRFAGNSCVTPNTASVLEVGATVNYFLTDAMYATVLFTAGLLLKRVE